MNNWSMDDDYMDYHRRKEAGRLHPRRIYLAGPIFKCTDDQAVNWRDEARDLLAGYELVDPMDRDYRGIETGNEEALVANDKADILGCDLVLAMAVTPSAGTSMEILFAWERRIPVITIAASPCSPWIFYHSTVVVGSLDRAAHEIGALA